MNICTLGFLFILRTTIVGVLHEPTNFQVVSAHSTFPKFNRILVLVFALVLVLSVLSLLSFHPLLFALAVLAFVLFTLAFCHAPMSIWSFPPGCDEPSCFAQLLDLFTHSMFCFFFFSKHHAKSILHGSTVRVSRDHLQQSFKGTNSNVFQNCVHFLEHLIGYNSVSRDFPSCRWCTSVQAISFASATESPSRDFVLVPLCMGSTFRAAIEAMVTSC